MKPATSPVPRTAAVPVDAAAAPAWASAPLGASPDAGLGDDAAAWDDLARRLAPGQAALGSAALATWLPAQLRQAGDRCRLVWLGARHAPRAMGLLESLGAGHWRVLAPPAASMGALLTDDLRSLQDLAAGLPGPLQRLDWPRWDPAVLPLDLGADVDLDVTPAADAVTDTAPGTGQRQADLRLHLGRGARLRQWLDRPRLDRSAGAMAGLHTRCDDGLDTLPAPARALLDAQTPISLQLGTDWLSMMEAVLRKDAGSALRVHSLWRGDQPLAVVAMHRRRAAGWPGAAALHSLSNYYSVVWAPALAAGVDAAQLLPLVHAMRRAPHGAGQLEFVPVDPNAPSTWAWTQALRAAGLVVLRLPAFGNWTYEPAGGAEDWKTYLTGRTSKLRSNIKRARQRLADRGGQLEILTRPEDMPRAMAAYEAVYGKSWKQAEPHPEFFRQLAERWAPLDRVRIGVAWLDGQPIAAQWWTHHAGVSEIHKVAYDEAHSELSPGTALSAEMIAHALDHDHAAKLDYLIGDDGYKRLWMARRASRCRLLAYDPRSAAGLAGCLRELASQARQAARARRAQQTPGSTGSAA